MREQHVQGPQAILCDWHLGPGRSTSLQREEETGGKEPVWTRLENLNFILQDK